MVSKVIAQAIARDALKIEAKNQKILRDNLLIARQRLLDSPGKWQYGTFEKMLSEVLEEYERAANEQFPIQQTIEHGAGEGQLFSGIGMDVPKDANFWQWRPVIPSAAIAMESSKFADLITNATADFKHTALRTVQQGLAMGASTQDLMDDLLGVGLRGSKGRDGKFRKAVTRAETIGRTVSNDLINRGAMITYGQIDRISPELNLKKIWQTLSDNRTSERCIQLSGQIRELNEPFQAPDGWTGQNPPAHPNCRSRVTSRAANRNYNEDIDKKFAATAPKPLAMPTKDPLSEALPPDLQKMKLSELKQLAIRKGIDQEKVREFGALNRKQTWVDALQGKKSEPKKEKPKAKKEQKSSVSGEFPSDVSKLKRVKSLGGSTGAELVEDPETGRRFVMKRGANAGHLREEWYADEAYRALGVPVPKGKLYEEKDGPVKLTEFIEGQPLSSLKGKARKEAEQKLQKHFAADAILGNWDVVGLSEDNILVGKDGIPYRIDNGGALRYRAMGEQKKDAWNNYPTELFSLRDARANQQTAKAFGGLGYADMLGQIEGIDKQRDSLIKALPPDLRKVMGARLDEAMEMTRTGRTLLEDRFNEKYTEAFTKHGLNFRANGMVDKLPEKMFLGKGNRLYDADGYAFDDLRGEGRTKDLQEYIEAQGWDFSAVSDWARSQGRSSWSENPSAVKRMIADARGNENDYFWLRSSKEDSRDSLENIKKQHPHFEETMTAYHAFNYQMLQKIDMPNNNKKKGTFTIYRTESSLVLKDNGIKLGDKGATMKRGANESGSAFTPVSAVAGSSLTIQEVPHHRIYGTYLLSRDKSGRDTFFGDRENEFVFIPEGIKFDYVKGVKRYAAKPNLKIKKEDLKDEKWKSNPSQTTPGVMTDLEFTAKVMNLPGDAFDEILDDFGGDFLAHKDEIIKIYLTR